VVGYSDRTAAAPGDSAGFTLVEVLVGLALFGLLTLAMVGAVRLGLIGGQRVDAASAAAEDLRATARLFAHLVERGEPMPDWSGREGDVAFVGEPAALTFVAVLPQGAGGRLGLVRLRQDQARLIAEICALDMAPARLSCAGPVARSALAENVRRLDFAYFGAAAPDASARWQSAWRGRPDMPLAVRLSVVTERGAWPAMIVRPMIETAP